MQVIKPPTDLWEIHDSEGFSLFAGGSIEQGAAEMWQDRLAVDLQNINGSIYNPRRDDWDSTLEQRISNPQFLGQLEWEYLAMELATKLFFYFDPNTKSPITIGEVYMLAPTVDPSDMTVVCPDGFWRKGNIEFICHKFDIPVFNTFMDGLIHSVSDIDEKFLVTN